MHEEASPAIYIERREKRLLLVDAQQRGNVKLHGNIDDPVLEDILRMLTKEFGHEWSGKIARFSDNLWIACGHGEMRKFSISLHGDYLIAKPIYVIETGEKK